MSTVKTAKGTELRLSSLKGKPYLEVPQRVLWMREERPEWGLETEFLTISDQEAVARAVVKDEHGRVISQGTKRCTAQSFPLGWIEKAETGAIGRALGFAGFGTQFALDLDYPDDGEGPVISDAPANPRNTPKPNLQAVGPSDDLGAFVLRFGKFKGQRLDAIDLYELNGYYAWLKQQQKPNEKDSDAMIAINLYLSSREVPRAK